jgi:pre-mRNA-splicing factor 38A
MGSKKSTVFADARRFLDDRYETSLAPNGLNPATIMEKAVRERIVGSYFWTDRCFALNEADIVDRVVQEVRFIGGTYGVSQKPTPFLCLAFKLLQLSPSDEILNAYLNMGGEKFKYLRALACFYVRLTRQAKDIYLMLEPHLADYRKLRSKGRTGTKLIYVDEFVDQLLTKDRVCATSLWKMAKRDVLEDLDVLEPRVSPLGDIEDLLDDDEPGDQNGDADESNESPSEDGNSARNSMEIEEG